MPKERLCAEERRGWETTRPKRKPPIWGRFESEVGQADFGTQQGSFQAFSMG